ncbi:MAG: 1-deoxy-D-xylulose-5-phosphate synthase [Candidatus Omnitrophica bacterium]|nr:1-deoxy-D-xylulose-5-phosphate synthase [Candidatus Omnitrophota bacterium]
MFLERINSPQDLKTLKPEELKILACEIRLRMTQVVSQNGGHLASSLGAVELILALHYCFNTPKDKIVFDVGHQSYAHKILTGRNINFETLRQYGGLSGFPSKDESEFDSFTTGHSSTAVSLALGLACARDYLSPENHFKVIAVIGDGSLSGGLCFEGLNNAGHLKKDMLVVLNTNELSIAPNSGALSIYLNKIISMPIYNRFKESLEHFAESRLPKGSRLVKLANKFEEGLKGLFVPGMLFEELGFRYFGPFDGHDTSLLIHTIKNISNFKGPLLLHVVTKKGKGYAPAENEPVRFHGTGPFEIDSGITKAKAQGSKTFTEVFSEKLLNLAKVNKKIVAVSAAMPEGTGLDKFRDNFPQRFFDVGIAEEHAVVFAAGLARAGLKPVVAIYSTFLQRAYDEIMEAIALQNLGVVLAVDRAGLVGEDGVTHQGIFDIAFLMTVPNMTILAPCDGRELEKMLEFALDMNTPVAIRYPKDKVITLPSRQVTGKIQMGKAETLKEGNDFTLIALGSMVNPAIEAANLLEKSGLSGTVIDARFAKPLDKELFRTRTKDTKFIFSAEEGIIDGGFGSAVEDYLGKPVVKFGLPCEFIAHGKRNVILDKFALTAAGIADRIKSVCRR